MPLESKGFRIVQRVGLRDKSSAGASWDLPRDTCQSIWSIVACGTVGPVGPVLSGHRTVCAGPTISSGVCSIGFDVDKVPDAICHEVSFGQVKRASQAS
jgi:hypothetical protein